MEQVIKDEIESKRNLDKVKDAKQRMKEKINSYSKYVKEIHWPEISSRKQEQLEEIKSKIKHPVRHPRNAYEGDIDSSNLVTP